MSGLGGGQVSNASEQIQRQMSADLAVIFLILQSSILDVVRAQPQGSRLLANYKAWVLAAVESWPANCCREDQAQVTVLMRERAEGLFQEMEMAVAMDNNAHLREARH